MQMSKHYWLYTCAMHACDANGWMLGFKKKVIAIMCFGFLTNLFTELTVRVYSPETQIAHGLLKWQFPLYIYIYIHTSSGVLTCTCCRSCRRCSISLSSSSFVLTTLIVATCSFATFTLTSCLPYTPIWAHNCCSSSSAEGRWAGLSFKHWQTSRRRGCCSPSCSRSGWM